MSFQEGRVAGLALSFCEYRPIHDSCAETHRLNWYNENTQPKPNVLHTISNAISDNNKKTKTKETEKKKKKKNTIEE